MSRTKSRYFFVAFLLLFLAYCYADSHANDKPKQDGMKNVIVYAQEGKFCGWPANNGVWIWDGKEILVGLSLGDFIEHDGHNIVRASLRSVVCRSVDGGESWTLEDPNSFVGDGGRRRDVPDGLDFTDPGFVMRVGAVGYWASEEKRGELFFSSDRGRTWLGPCPIGGLLDHPELQNVVVTSRTDYLINSRSECLLFCSARNSKKWKSDRVFCARSVDAGKTFQFANWIVPPTDPYRAVMPNTVRCSKDMLVSAIRRRPVSGPSQDCWIDIYVSKDNGQSWKMHSIKRNK